MNPFLKHPREVKMSYFGHMLYAFTVFGRLFFYSFAVLIHAFFPFMFTHATSKMIEKMNDEFKDR